LNFLERLSKHTQNIKFHKNPISGNQIGPCVRTDMKKLIVAFSNFANFLAKEIRGLEL